jgi:signal transduction histidine kinase
MAKQIKNAHVDGLGAAFQVAEQSPIPMTLVVVDDDQVVTYVTANAGTKFVLPTKSQLADGKKAPIQMGQYLTRFFQLSADEYLGYYVSTAEIDRESASAFKSILFFNFLLILFCAVLVTVLFRRDSKLNSAAKGMQEFIGDASHELKTPLTVIRGYSEILSSGSDASAKYANRIHDESLRMNSIIDSLLKIAALDEGHSEPPVSIDIAEYLKSHIEDIKMLQPNRKITFSSHPLMVKAPYDIVDTLLSNILTNARVHSPENTPINISINKQLVTIEDGGPGIATIPDKPFQRFDTSRSRETGGSGLGMSLIQKCAKELGAKLNFSKSDLGGLKVEITF